MIKTLKITKILTALLLATSLTSGLLADIKRYQIKSGIVEYQISGGGNIAGISIETKGKSKLIFKDWGNLELQDEQSSTTTMGNTQKSHNIIKMENGKVYNADFNEKVIIKMGTEMLAQSENTDMTKMGEEMEVSMSGKKIGNEKILGYNCEIWEIMGVKTWIYKGVSLKTEVDMDLKQLKVATKAKFNVSIADSEFKLPDFPVKTLDQMLQDKMGGFGMPQGKAP